MQTPIFSQHIGRFKVYKIAVFGSNGMAGHTIVKYLRYAGYNVTTVARSNADLICDVEYQQMVASTLLKLEGYDYIINCIGLLVRDCNSRPDRAAVLNSWWPHHLEQWSSRSKTRIVHISTDCVFDGARGRYLESDMPTETNIYGKSKSLGELDNYKDITFRTSIIGPELKSTGSGLMNWVITGSNQTIPGYIDHWWNGLTTLQLAKCIHSYILNPTVSGIYHLVDNTVCINKFELVELINRVWKLGKQVNPVPGPKPVNKILIDSRLDRDWGIPIYETQLQEAYSFHQE